MYICRTHEKSSFTRLIGHRGVELRPAQGLPAAAGLCDRASGGHAAFVAAQFLGCGLERGVLSAFFVLSMYICSQKHRTSAVFGAMSGVDA